MRRKATRSARLDMIRVLLLVALLVVGVAPVYAHASLLGTDPASGAVLATAPQRLTLNFSEPAGALALLLIHPDTTQTTIPIGSVSSAGNQIVVPLPTGLGDGTHVLSWRAASSDGHPISGAVIFSIGTPSQAAPVGATENDPVVRGLLWFARATMLVTLLLGAGSSSFRMVAAALPAPARRVAFGAITVGAVATIATIPLNGLDALGRSLDDVAKSEIWLTTMTGAYGATAIMALVAMALAGVALLARRANLAGWISLLSLVAIGLTAALSGHASSADPRWLTRTMIFLHVASIAWWAGELLPLALLLRQAVGTAKPPLMRFSQFIPFVIAPLVISGVVLAVIQLGSPGPSWWTAYTYLLIAKLALLLVLFTVAAWNRWYLTSRVVAGQQAAIRHLRSAILFEIVLIVTIIGVAAGWRFTPPPRSIAIAMASAERLVELDFTGGSLSGTLSIVPARVGPNDVTLALFQEDGSRASARSVRVFLDNPDLGLEKLELVGALDQTGNWQAKDAVLPAAGSWVVSVEVRISDFEQARSSATIIIGE